VTAASQAQLVNTISSIRTEPNGPAWRQSIFHPFALMSKHAAGQVLDLRLDAPTLATAKFGEVPLLDSVATYDAGEGKVAVFVVNRNPTEAVSFATSLRGFDGGELVEAVVLADDDLTAANTQDDPDRVVPRTHPSATVTDGVLTAELPPASWNMFLVAVGTAGGTTESSADRAAADAR